MNRQASQLVSSTSDKMAMMRWDKKESKLHPGRPVTSVFRCAASPPALNLKRASPCYVRSDTAKCKADDPESPVLHLLSDDHWKYGVI